MIKSFRSAREAASAYIDRGFTVSPLFGVDEQGCLCRDSLCEQRNWGKHHIENDALVKSGHVFSTNDFNVKDNISIWLGDDNKNSSHWIVGIDLDRSQDVNDFCYGMPDTLTCLTKTGKHLYYSTAPETFCGNWVDCFKTKPEASLDIRYKGGRLVAPPSRGAFGVYEWIDFNKEIKVLPDHFLQLVYSFRQSYRLPVKRSWSEGRS